MADSVPVEVFIAVLLVTVLLGLVLTIYVYRYGVWKGHVAALSGQSLASALTLTCATRDALERVRPQIIPNTDDSAAVKVITSTSAASRGGRPIVPRLQTDALAAKSSERPRSVGGGIAGLSNPQSVRELSASGRGHSLPSAARPVSTAESHEHVDDGEEIIERRRVRMAAGPKSEKEVEDQYLSQIASVPWSEVHLMKAIGEGSFGKVFRGEFLGVDCAVKLAKPDVCLEEGFLQRFRRECAIMAQIHHPNILALQAVVIDAPARKFAIITPFCPNGDLMSFLKAPPSVHKEIGVHVTFKLITRFALDIARGCRFLHIRARVIQRDLKLANVLVDSSFNALLADFGLSRIVGKQRESVEDGEQPMTPCGSPAWTAPEIVKMLKYTDKVDVFSFGIMMWQLVTREEPYPGEEQDLELAMAVAHKGKRPKIPDYCPKDYADLMTQCWQEDPGDRPDFVEILQRLAVMRKTDGSKTHKVALVPDLHTLLEEHQADIDRAKADTHRLSARSSGEEPSTAAATAAASGAGDE